MIDWFSVAIGLVAAVLFGGIALYITVYAPPGNEKLANALVDAAVKLLDAAIKAINKSMQKQDTVIGADTFDPVPEQRLNDLVDMKNNLRYWVKRDEP